MYDIRKVIQQEIMVHPLEMLLLQPKRFFGHSVNSTWSWANVTAVFGCDMATSWLWVENAINIQKTLGYHGRLMDYGLEDIAFKDFERVIKENVDIPIAPDMMRQIHQTYLDYRYRPIERFILNPDDVTWAFREIANNHLYPKRRVFYKEHFTLGQCLARHLSMSLLDYHGKPADMAIKKILTQTRDLRIEHRDDFRPHFWTPPICAFKTPKGFLTY